MKKYITVDDLDALALGATLLGSGGGGNPEHGKKLAKQALEEFGPVPLITVYDLNPDDLIAPVSFMGAPLIHGVKKPTGKEFIKLLDAFQAYYGKKPAALLAAEIGGSNGFSPLLCAGQLQIPVIDGDTIGRAFPELPMTSCALAGIPTVPTFFCSVDGTVVVIKELSKELTLEQLCRQLIMLCGSKGALISDIMTGKQAQNAIIQGSYTRAIWLGHSMLSARNKGKNSIDALITDAHAKIVGNGVIKTLKRELRDGFVVGFFGVETQDGIITVYFKNENLIVYQNEKVITTTPDSIIPVDRKTGFPLTVEQLEQAQEVTVLTLESPELWKTPQGLALVGPQVFGFKTEYRSLFSKK